MFDEEHEAVQSVKESETLGAGLLAGTKQARVDHYALETVEASRPLGVTLDWEVAISGEDCVLPGGRVFVDLVAKFTWKFLERKRAVWLISRCPGFVKVLTERYTDWCSSCTIRREAFFSLLPEWGRPRRRSRCLSSAFFCFM